MGYGVASMVFPPCASAAAIRGISFCQTEAGCWLTMVGGLIYHDFLSECPRILGHPALIDPQLGAEGLD